MVVVVREPSAFAFHWLGSVVGARTTGCKNGNIVGIGGLLKTFERNHCWTKSRCVILVVWRFVAVLELFVCDSVFCQDLVV